jgi:post-segregation antitoxin (ccd killing protein)
MPETNVPSDQRSDITCPEISAAAQKTAREKKWLEDNRGAFEYWNKYYEENGLTLEKFRTF